MADGNVNETGSKVSGLAKLLKSLEGQPKPNASDKKAIVNAFKSCQGERAKLVKALEDFDKQADAAAVNMVRVFGSKHIDLDGVRYVPTSRGDRVYYKKMGNDAEVEKL